MKQECGKAAEECEQDSKGSCVRQFFSDDIFVRVKNSGDKIVAATFTRPCVEVWRIPSRDDFFGRADHFLRHVRCIRRFEPVPSGQLLTDYLHAR